MIINFSRHWQFRDICLVLTLMCFDLIIMVGNLSGNNIPGDRSDQNEPPRVTRIIRNHSINHNRLKDLIKGSLDPLVVDPVPSKILISNIVITRTTEGVIDISCDVAYLATPSHIQ